MNVNDKLHEPIALHSWGQSLWCTQV